MTKKQYFMLLWGVCSIAPIIKAITMLVKDEIPPVVPPIALMAIATLIGGVCIYGFFLSFGMDFARKIGLRFLLLDAHVDWYKDFLWPAVVIGTLYSCLLLVINIFTPVLFPFSAYYLLGYYVIFYKAIETVFNIITEDAFAILFVFSGLVLLIKKIAKNVSMSIVIPLVITCIVILPNAIEYIWPPAGTPFVLNIAKFRIGMDAALLFTVAWLKGFETALFFHVVTTIILSLIVPVVIIALGA